MDAETKGKVKAKLRSIKRQHQHVEGGEYSSAQEALGASRRGLEEAAEQADEILDLL